jgi:hypothetical protein
MAATVTRAKLKKRNEMPQRNTRCPLLTMGNVFEGEDGYTYVNATTALYISVTPEHAAKALVSNSNYCVMGVAMRAAFGDKYQYEIGAGIIKIVDLDEKVVVRFATPSLIAAHIKVFDKTGQWDLPPRMYRLAPLPKSWHGIYEPNKKAKGAKGKKKKTATHKVVAGVRTIVRGVTKRKRAASTRVIMRHRAGTRARKAK